MVLTRGCPGNASELDRCWWHLLTIGQMAGARESIAIRCQISGALLRSERFHSESNWLDRSPAGEANDHSENRPFSGPTPVSHLMYRSNHSTLLRGVKGSIRAIQ